jgi:hypothetical protein
MLRLDHMAITCGCVRGWVTRRLQTGWKSSTTKAKVQTFGAYTIHRRLFLATQVGTQILGRPFKGPTSAGLPDRRASKS